MHTDVDASDCTRGLYGQRKALKADSGREKTQPLLHQGLEPESILRLSFQLNYSRPCTQWHNLRKRGRWAGWLGRGRGAGVAAMSPDLPVSYRLRGCIIPACRDPSSSFSFLFSVSSSVHRPAVGLFDP